MSSTINSSTKEFSFPRRVQVGSTVSTTHSTNDLQRDIKRVISTTRSQTSSVIDDDNNNRASCSDHSSALRNSFWVRSLSDVDAKQCSSIYENVSLNHNNLSGENAQSSSSIDRCHSMQQFEGKAKFRDSQPTLVSKRDFELVHKALSLQQQRSRNLEDNETIDFPDSISTNLDSSSGSSLANASVTSDFIAWLDTPLASAPAVMPPLLTFSKEEKGQPLTVSFYHGTTATSDEQCQEIRHDDQQLFPSGTQDATALRRSFLSTPNMMQDRTPDKTPQLPTLKVTLKFSAGVCLLRKRIDESNLIPEVLVIRRRAEKFFELPKGHLEKGESLIQAAQRELVEETGIKSPIEIGSFLLSERYVVRKSASERLEKSVHYFRARLLDDSPVVFGEREEDTKELKWIGLDEAKKAFWKSNAVRSVIIIALTNCDNEF